MQLLCFIWQSAKGVHSTCDHLKTYLQCRLKMQRHGNTDTWCTSPPSSSPPKPHLHLSLLSCNYFPPIYPTNKPLHESRIQFHRIQIKNYYFPPIYPSNKLLHESRIKTMKTCIISIDIKQQTVSIHFILALLILNIAPF